MIPLDMFSPKSQLRVPAHDITRAKFPVIDAHNHLHQVQDVKALLEAMDAFHIRMIVDLDGEPGPVGDAQLARLSLAHPDRFAVFVQISLDEIDSPGFAAAARQRICNFAARGAAGIKFHKWLGLRARDASGRMLKPDDDRLRPIWEEAAKHDLPVTIHIGDPIAFFDPIDASNERYEELIAHPDWSFAGPEFYPFDELMESQHRLLAQNRDTRFIVAHIGAMAEDLARVSQMLDTHPNLFVDTAERIAELGRQPYSARAFLLKHQDRVLYGTDLVPRRHNISANYRFFETFDEYFPYNDWAEHHQGRWNIYGVGLPDDVLRKIYYENACQVIPVLGARYAQK